MNRASPSYLCEGRQSLRIYRKLLVGGEQIDAIHLRLVSTLGPAPERYMGQDDFSGSADGSTQIMKVVPLSPIERRQHK